MKITRESLEKSLELAELPSSIGTSWYGPEDFKKLVETDADFIAHHSPIYITALVQAHIEALEILQGYANQEKYAYGQGYKSDANEFLKKHGGVE